MSYFEMKTLHINFSDETTCPESYTLSTKGHFCFLTSTVKMPISSGEYYCEQHKGRLVTIENEGKQTAVQTFLKRK
jgi:hypothetical protein